MTQAIADFLLKIFFQSKEAVTVLIAILPVVEVRGAIPFAMIPEARGGFGMHPFFAWLYSFLGSSAIVPLLLLGLLPLINWLRKTKFFKKIGDVLYEKFEKGAKGIKKSDTPQTADGTNALEETNPAQSEQDKKAARKKEWKNMLGVFLFVAIPLPLTGVWTGSAIAAIIGLKFPKALASVIAGNLVASSIMVTLSVLFMPFIDWITLGIFIVAAVIILILVLKIIIPKRKPKAEN